MKSRAGGLVRLLGSVGGASRGQSGDSSAGASLSPGWTSAAALLTSRSKAREAPTEWTACRTLGRSMGEVRKTPRNSNSQLKSK